MLKFFYLYEGTFQLALSVSFQGFCVNYPTLRLRVQKEEDGFRLTCSVDSCMENRDALKGSAAHVCQRPPGTLMSCQGLELERLPPAQEPLGRSDEHPVVLVKEGEVTPFWSEILPDLQVTDSSQSSPVVKIPKNIVFQRRYWAAFESRNSTFKGSSVIEVPTQGLPGFFLISATGFSFFETLRVHISWTEDRKPNAHVTQDAQISSVQQFPDVEELKNWTILAYRLSPPITYPDSADGQLVTFDWFLPATQNSLEERHVIDTFWIVDVDKEPLEKLRAWIVSESTNRLELYVYFQHSNSRGVFSENLEANIELLEFGCPPEATSRSLASLTVKTKGFTLQNSTAEINVDNREYGRGAFIKYYTYSTAFGYELRALVKKDSEIFTKTLLSIPPAAESRLKLELEGEFLSAFNENDCTL
ncbi:hypothetical protein SprV_0501823800 [Sparganum proliferum]